MLTGFGGATFGWVMTERGVVTRECGQRQSARIAG